MNKFIIVIALVVIGLFLPYKPIFAGYCIGVSKCAEWGLAGACSNILIDAKVCNATTEEECYKDDVECAFGCVAGSCTWVREWGDPTPTPGGGGGGASCATTAPSRLKITRGSPNVTITWRPGSGGSYQLLRVSDNPLAVRFNCSSGGYTLADCIVAKSLASGISSYTVPAATFDDNSIYYVKVVESAGVCSLSTTKPWMSTCTMTPASWTFSAPNQTRAFTVPIVDTFYAYTGLKEVTFSSDDTAVATVDPATDTNAITQNETFRTTATAESVDLPATSVESRVVLRSDEYGNFVDCGASSPVGPIKLQCLSSRFLRVVKSH